MTTNRKDAKPALSSQKKKLRALCENFVSLRLKGKTKNELIKY